jgi:hypothetical protein
MAILNRMNAATESVYPNSVAARPSKTGARQERHADSNSKPEPQAGAAGRDWPVFAPLSGKVPLWFRSILW